jgi:hypothetical protein
MLDFPALVVLCTVIHHRRWVTALSSRIWGKSWLYTVVQWTSCIELRFVHVFPIVQILNRWGLSLSSTLCAQAHRTVQYMYLRGHKRCRLSWLTNSALVYEPICGGGGGVGGKFAGSQPMSTAVHKAHRAQINFGDLTPHLTYDGPPIMANEWEWAFFWPIAIHPPVMW